MSALQSDEAAVVAFLSDADAYPHPVYSVGVIETHISRIFLAGDYAYKIKKPLALPFLDFSTLDLRREAVDRELEINKPYAPEIYLGIVAITRCPDGTLSFDNTGTPIEYAVKMRRFDQSSLLSRHADAGPLSRALCRDLAGMIANYHQSAPVSTGAAAVDEMQRTVANLAAQVAELNILLDDCDIPLLCARLADAATKAHPLMIARANQGAVRRCHGDLHLNNIVLVSGRPLPFDALEFDERLAIIDVLYDLAFLLMDLDASGDRNAANAVLNAYVSSKPVGHEIEGMALLPLFLATRAIVRAVIAAQRSKQLESDPKGAAIATAARHLRLTFAYLAPPRPFLIAVGGLSGTGKTTLAASIAPLFGSAPGALHLRSDVERKQLFHVAETARLGPEAYTEDITHRVYTAVLAKAAKSLEAGHAVVVDVVASKPEERQTIAALAKEAGVAFVGLWLEAPLKVLIDRVEARRGDASDADATVVRRQAEYNLGMNSWIRIDASGTPDETLEKAKSAMIAAGIELNSFPPGHLAI